MPYRQSSHTTAPASTPLTSPSRSPSYSSSPATVARTYPSRHTQQQLKNTPSAPILTQPVSAHATHARLSQTHSSQSTRFSRPRKARAGKAWLAGGSVAFLAALAIIPAKFDPTLGHTSKTICQKAVRSEAQLSREQLSKFLSVPTQSSKTAIQGVLQEPYCILSPLTTQANEELSREAYPLAFDPDTWFVVLYQGEEYTGYDFTFRH